MEDKERAELIDMIVRLTPEQTMLVISRMKEMLAAREQSGEAPKNVKENIA